MVAGGREEAGGGEEVGDEAVNAGQTPCLNKLGEFGFGPG